MNALQHMLERKLRRYGASVIDPVDICVVQTQPRFVYELINALAKLKWAMRLSVANPDWYPERVQLMWSLPAPGTKASNFHGISTDQWRQKEK